MNIHHRITFLFPGGVQALDAVAQTGHAIVQVRRSRVQVAGLVEEFPEEVLRVLGQAAELFDHPCQGVDNHSFKFVLHAFL